MMSTTAKAHSITGEAEVSHRENGIKHCSSGTEADTLWPFRMKIEPDNIRWDSLKIPASEEFESHILANLDEASRKLLDAHHPIELQIADADTRETYKTNLVKKEAFWFEPLTIVGPKKKKSWCFKFKKQKQHTSNDSEKSREEFAYSIEPFRHIAKKRNLSCNQVIGFGWSSNGSVVEFNFSVVHAPWLDLNSYKNIRGHSW